MIMTLVNGGSHIDFRTRNEGLTALHKSAIYNRKEAIVVSYRKCVFFYSIFIEIKFRLYLNLVHLQMFMMKKV